MARGWIWRIERRFRARPLLYLARETLARIWPTNLAFDYLRRRRFERANWLRINATSILNLKRREPTIDDAQQEILSDLRKVGCHVTGIEKLFSDTTAYPSLKSSVTRLLESSKVQRQLQSRQSDEGIKWYVVRAFGFKPRQ